MLKVSPLGDVQAEANLLHRLQILQQMQADTCKVRTFEVGVLTPDWLKNATYLGVETVDTVECHKWSKADFLTYWASIKTGHPIRWLFFDGSQFDIMSYEPGRAPPEEILQAPLSCFENPETA